MSEFRCSLKLQQWGVAGVTEVQLEKGISIGRSPTKGGLQIAQNDEYVSANAVSVQRKKNGVEIRNTSSHAQIEIHHLSGVRFVFPGEGFIITQSSRINIPSRDFTYVVEIQIEGLEISESAPTHTKRLVPEDLEISHERLPALAGLCASYLFPQLFGSSPLKASDISVYLAKKGMKLTPKAINHKIQRTREQVEEFTGSYVDDREGLALFLIKNRIITADDVREFLIDR
jgi:hypothetical protein